MATLKSSFLIPHSAMLLLGPTGSGKTPLGNALEANGLAGRRCVHVDFGSLLRRVDKTSDRILYSEAELAVVADSLRSGALLENEHVPIALKVIDQFMRSRRVEPETLVVLNGFPRHVGQAEALSKLLTLSRIVYLVCPAEAVYERIRQNSGGDRTGRVDDTLNAVTGRLTLFKERTAPLLGYYGRKGVPIWNIDVGVDTTHMELLKNLEVRTKGVYA